MEKLRFIQFLPLVIFVIGFGLFFTFELDRFLTFDALRENYGHLTAFVYAQGSLSPLLYVLLYTLSVAFSIPGAVVLTIAGGLLFGQWLGAFYAVIGATLGSSFLFLVTRAVIGDMNRKNEGATIKKMQAGFQENALSYLLVLRLIPVFPFFLVNIAPALLGVSLPVYLIGTFFGIIPGSLVYAAVGSGLGSIFEKNEKFSLQGIMTLEMMVALSGLIVLALLPVVYKKLKNSPNHN